MTPLEQYLQNATRGIWGKRTLEIREELESDILERAKKFELGGLSQDQAVEKAILELGDARVVNNGMTGIYTMPTVLKTSIMAAIVLFSITAMTKPVNAVKQLPPLEVSCVKPSGVQYSFELYPTKRWKHPNNAAITQAFKLVVLNWQQNGIYLPKLEQQIGATVRASIKNLGRRVSVSQRPSRLECHRYKFGALEDLQIVRKSMKEIMAQIKLSAKLPKR
jgi:hypothetical protein